ncbi:MAG: hypothetical protein U9O64_08005 [Campylobacterota bacterium]|nr:hypothetical protein [Campylobacterota bacterium]
MPQSDNVYYYIAYGLILLTFFIVLKTPKTPKKNKNKKDKKDKNNEA